MSRLYSYSGNVPLCEATLLGREDGVDGAADVWTEGAADTLIVAKVEEAALSGGSGLSSNVSLSTDFFKKFVQSSPSEGWLAPVGTGSEKMAACRAGVLGVRPKGEAGKRRVLADAPGLARPTFSLTSSFHSRMLAKICKISNFLGSDRSRTKNATRLFVMTPL